MVLKKIFRCLAVIAICSLLLTAGCAPEAKEIAKPQVKPEEEKPKVVVETAKPEVKPEVKPDKEKPAVELALKFVAGDSTTYKSTIQAQRSIRWEGPLPNKGAFKGGQTSSRVEITFTRQIQSVDENGNAVAKITIEALKYLSIIKDNPALDFDSSRFKDQNHFLAKLIGQSYTIEITPAGQVSKVIDVIQAQAALRGVSSADKTASALLSPDAIKERHTIPAMPAADKKRLRTGDSWNGLKTFSFGLMGSKSYERTYTLKEVKETGSRRVAVVEMKAAPTSEMAEQLHQQQTVSSFSKMFDNTETFTGQLELDLTAGKVENCFEKLESEWIAVEPIAGQKDDKEPAVLKMTAIRIYRLEKTD